MGARRPVSFHDQPDQQSRRAPSSGRGLRRRICRERPRSAGTYRAWHQPTLEDVQREMTAIFHDELELPPEHFSITGRPLKTPGAIVAKLVRLRTRLSRMRDIAGTRITVPTLELQERASELVLAMFRDRDGSIERDTVERGDQWGYRAIHVVATLEGRFAEIQIRTSLQDAWAQIVENVDQIPGWDLKHGQGPADWIEWLITLSDALRRRDLGHPAELPSSPFDRLLEAEEESS